MATVARYFLLEFAQQILGLHDLSTKAYFVFCAGVFAALLWWCWRVASSEGIDGSRNKFSGTSAKSLVRVNGYRADAAFLAPAFSLAAALMFLFSPHYAWYVVWLVPFFTLIPNLSILVYVLGFFYLYTTALAEPGPKMFFANEILYASVFAAFVIQLVLRRWPVHRTLFVQPIPASDAL